MKRNLTKLTTFAILLSLFAGFSSCSEDEEPTTGDNTPTTIQADNEWVEGVIAVNQELWYKVSGVDASFTTLFVEWAELENQGENHNFTADIKVSAYMLDGETPYFEGKNNGYKDNKKSIALTEERDVLLKVELNDATKPGTFALRSTGEAVADTEIEYIKVTVGDVWYQTDIAEGKVVGFNVDCLDVAKVNIIWLESETDETYTADVKGSVYHKDAVTPYKILGKTDDFLDKDNSKEGNPKGVEVDQTEKKVKVHFKVGTKAGTFAFKAVEIVE